MTEKQLHACETLQIARQKLLTSNDPTVADVGMCISMAVAASKTQSQVRSEPIRKAIVTIRKCQTLDHSVRRSLLCSLSVLRSYPPSIPNLPLSDPQSTHRCR